MVDVHELIAWGLDDYPYRSSAVELMREESVRQVAKARQRLAERECYTSCPALLTKETESIRPLLVGNAQRADLQGEYEGLDWTLGVVDLRRLLAFQRRLAFSAATWSALPTPQQDDWPGLISLAVGPERDTEHCLVRNHNSVESLDISLHSSNPDLQLRLKAKARPSTFSHFFLHGGCPFFEVAELRGRWFLRDGYHRAYRLLQAEVYRVPAVVIHARTIEELGATETWFFDEAQLFSDRPPQVTDFLKETMVLRYERKALRKIIRVRIEESLEPIEADEVQGEEL